MTDEGRPTYQRRCAAMIAAGIYDPESKEGIDFCINYCPYDCCVVFEQPSAKQLKARGKTKVAKILRGKGVSIDDIALLLEMSVRNVQRYLKR